MTESNDTSIPHELLQLYDLANTQVWELYTNFFSLAVESGLFALSTASFIVSTHLLSARRLFRNRAILAMWLTTVVMFSVSTVHYVLSCVFLNAALETDQLNIDVYIEDYAGRSDQSRDSPKYLTLMNRLLVAFLCLPNINYILNDLVVFWRAWILWDKSRKIAVLCGFCTLCNVAAALFESVSAAHPSTKWGPVGSCYLVWTTSLFSNVLATGLIAYKAWKHRATIRMNLEGRTLRMKTEAVLTLLVESGTLYCAIWGLYLFSLEYYIYHQSRGFDASQSFAMRMFTNSMPALMIQLSGIYPTVIIVLVTLQKTACDLTASQYDTASQAMNFATRGATLA